MQIRSFIEKNIIAILIWSFGTLFALINMWQTSQLNAGNLLLRVQAVEAEQADDNRQAEVLLPQFYQMQEKLDTLIKKVDDNKKDADQDREELKRNQEAANDKLDRLLFQTQ